MSAALQLGLFEPEAPDLPIARLNEHNHRCLRHEDCHWERHSADHRMSWKIGISPPAAGARHRLRPRDSAAAPATRRTREEPRMSSRHHADFAKAIRQLSHRHHTWRVFSDFCELAALALANAAAIGRRDAEWQRIEDYHEHTQRGQEG